MDEKTVVRVLLRHYWKKGLSAAAAAREICAVEGEDVVKEDTARWWFRRFREGDTTLEDQSRSGRPSVVNAADFPVVVNRLSCSSTRTLAEELNVSQSTVVRHLKNHGYTQRSCLRVPHELNEIQAQRRLDTCRQLLENPKDFRFWRRIVTADEKWVFFRNAHRGKQWLKPGQAPQEMVCTHQFEKKIMLCVFWNYEGPVHWELVPDGRAIDGKLYEEQLQRVYDALKVKYPSMVNRGQALLQHDNAPAHRSGTVKRKIEELPGIEVLPHPAYSPDIAPSDYHLFRSMSHFLRGRRFASEAEVATGLTEFFASKPPQWYQRGIECLAERWLKVVESEGLYFAE